MTTNLYGNENKRDKEYRKSAHTDGARHLEFSREYAIEFLAESKHHIKRVGAF